MQEVYVIHVVESTDDCDLQYVLGAYDNFADACRVGIDYMLELIGNNIQRMYYPMCFVIDCWEINSNKMHRMDYAVAASCNGWDCISLEDFERMKPCLSPP